MTAIGWRDCGLIIVSIRQSAFKFGSWVKEEYQDFRMHMCVGSNPNWLQLDAIEKTIIYKDLAANLNENDIEVCLVSFLFVFFPFGQYFHFHFYCYILYFILCARIN